MIAFDMLFMLETVSVIVKSDKISYTHVSFLQVHFDILLKLLHL